METVRTNIEGTVKMIETVRTISNKLYDEAKTLYKTVEYFKV